MKPLVSVIIPNYNYSKSLDKCFEALNKQTYDNFEIIFVDDCSTDNSVQMVEKYSFNKPIKIIRKKVNQGVSAARNTGADNASGELLFFLDSDVALFDDAIENTVREFQLDNKVGSVCGIYADKPLYEDTLCQSYRNLQGHYWRKTSEGFITAAFVSLGAIRKDAFYKVQGFDPKWDGTEDLEFGHRFTQKYPLLLTSKVMGYHDDEETLSLLCKKLHFRAVQRLPFYFRRKKFTKGFETPSRAAGLLFAGLGSMSLLLTVINVHALLLFALLTLLFIASDLGQYKFVAKQKGLLFTIYFTFAHWVVSNVVFYGFARGFIHFVVNREFRNKYIIDRGIAE